MTLDGSFWIPRRSRRWDASESRHRHVVFQENSPSVPTMTRHAQNLFLGPGVAFITGCAASTSPQQSIFLQSLNFLDVSPTATVGALGAAKKQMVEDRGAPCSTAPQ